MWFRVRPNTICWPMSHMTRRGIETLFLLGGLSAAMPMPMSGWMLTFCLKTPENTAVRGRIAKCIRGS